MKYIAVLLTVFNRKKQTMQCLENLFNQEIPEGYCIEVYLTNDVCTDGTPEAVRELYPQVHIIDGDGTLFWNRGMWTAWDAAAKAKDYDYYLWLNDDTFLYDGAIKELLSASSKYEDKAIIVGVTESLDHTKTTYGGQLPHKAGIPPVNGEDAKCETFNGNIVLIPQSVYHILGNVDPYYRHSAGDTDYGFRATKAGIDIYQVGEHLGACDEHPTLSDWCNPSVPLKKRWKSLYRPNGQPPHELYHLESKFYGRPLAVFHYITTHIHCLIPQLWIYLKKTQMEKKALIRKYGRYLSAIYRMMHRNSYKIEKGNDVRFKGVFLNHCVLNIYGRSNTVEIKSGLTRLYNSTITIYGSKCNVIIDEDCNLHNTHLYIEDNGGTIQIGKHVTITGETHLDVIEGRTITIGEDCLFSSNIQFRVGDSHSIIDVETGKRINPSKDIKIGTHVWIGQGVRVLKGANVSDNSIIATGAIVTGKTFPSNCIIGCSPAKVLKVGVNWDAHRLPIDD